MFTLFNFHDFLQVFPFKHSKKIMLEIGNNRILHNAIIYWVYNSYGQFYYNESLS